MIWRFARSGSSKILEKEVDELLIGKREAEFILAASIGARAARASALRRALDQIALDIVLISREQIFAHPPLRLRRKRARAHHRRELKSLRPRPASIMLRPREASRTACFTNARALRINRCRFPRLLPLASRRRSMMCTVCLSSLSHAHIPLNKSTNLTLSIPPPDHSLDELSVFFFCLAVFL